MPLTVEGRGDPVKFFVRREIAAVLRRTVWLCDDWGLDRTGSLARRAYRAAYEQLRKIEKEKP